MDCVKSDYEFVVKRRDKSVTVWDYAQRSDRRPEWEVARQGMTVTLGKIDDEKWQPTVFLQGERAMSRLSTWIVIAAFNEGSRLGATLQRLCNSGQGHSVVIVDDGSADDTASVAGRFPVWLLRHPVNCGQGAALQTGIEFALRNQAEAIVTFDADGQHTPTDIPQLLAPIEAGQADVVLGSRFRGSTIGMPWRRKLLLKAAVLFTRITARIQVTDAHNGLRAFSRDAAEKIRIRQPRMAHASEILEQISQHGLRYVEVPVTIRYTSETLEKGQSAWGAFRITSHLMLGRLMK